MKLQKLRQNWFIDLARAIVSESTEDAAAYFNYAIEAVSKFGDEIVQRWEAVLSLAERFAEKKPEHKEIAYRFIRCAELVGENVAREKHFNRNKAIKVCCQLSPVSGFAALSRWRDRNVGWVQRQLPALAHEVVSSEFISPSVGWSLSAFFDSVAIDDYAVLCIKKEQSKIFRENILDSAIRDLRLLEAGVKTWEKLKQVAERYSLENSELDEVLDYYVRFPEQKPKNEDFENLSLKTNKETKELIGLASLRIWI